MSTGQKHVQNCFIEMAKQGLREVEALLHDTLHGEHSDTPPRLEAALRDAIFPGGARLRPSLCLAVAAAQGHHTYLPQVVRCAAAVELMHSASLVHDDLPCFDNAMLRRGQPSIHAAYGQAMAVLVGDALIVQAFRVLAD